MNKKFLTKLKYFLQDIAFCAIAFGIFAGCMFGYWAIRPNQSNINPELDLEHYDIVADGRHNSNTDMIEWNGTYYMIHASAPYHMGSSDTYLALWKSSNMVNWESVANFTNPYGGDIRDPKFAIINNKMFIYVLLNDGIRANPHTTSYTYSLDGITFTSIVDLQGLDGWLFWRPKTFDNTTWYVPVYWHEHGLAILLNSTDGVNWTQVSQINEGDSNDETAIEFYPDGRMLATCRLEVTPDNPFGHFNGGTMLCISNPPYTSWNRTKSQVTRLDGPYLFPLNNEIYAIARYQPEIDVIFSQIGGSFVRKRTSLFLLSPEGITYISDFPSAGDTSYPGVVINNSRLYACYYTSDINKDYAWLLGMLTPSNIHMVNVSIPSILSATLSPNEHSPSLPWDGYLIFAGNIVLDLLLVYNMVQRRAKKRRKRTAAGSKNDEKLEKKGE